MENIIKAARELGKLIQKDGAYISYNLAAQAFESNHELQARISEFEKSREELVAEAQKEDKDAELLKELDKKVRDIYDEVSASVELQALNAAQQELQKMLGGINQIIQGSAAGEDPDTIDENVKCSSGSCSSCSGC